MLNTFRRLMIICLTLLVMGCSQQDSYHQFALSGYTMGTTYNIKVVTKKAIDPKQLQTEIDSLLVNVNQQMSTYIPDSELSLFNKAQANTKIEISKELAHVIGEGIRLGKITNGKLDITVGPLVNLWGFGPKGRPEKVPSQEAIIATKARIGFQKLSLDNLTLSKSQQDLYVDLSTIAKGYGVDVVADFLESQDLTNYLVEIGGEMRISGQKANQVEWRIAVEKPIAGERAMQVEFSPGNNAVATSGDYRNYFEQDGVRFSHIIDTHTGMPINHKLVSVTVLHPSSMTADGLSTALMTLGTEQAIGFAQREKLAVYMVTKTADGFEEYASDSFKQYVRN